MYQKHANPRATNNKIFAEKFHSTYTKPFIETLLLQVMLKDDGNKSLRHKNMELSKLSLACLANINRQNSEAAMLLIQYR